MAFTQTMTVQASSAEALADLLQGWHREQAGVAPGYQGARVLADQDRAGRYVVSVDFSSKEEADRNNERTETQEWAEKLREVAREQLPWLYALARRLVGQEAEDVVQECLIKAYRGYDGLRDEQAAPAWFRQILLNCVRDRFRRQAGLPREEPVDPLPDYSLYRKIAEEDPWPYSDSVHLDFLASFEEEDVWRVLDRIKPLYRAPLVLVHMEGLSTQTVARTFGVAQGTVLSWLHRGRKTFERELWTYAVEHGLLAEPKGARR